MAGTVTVTILVEVDSGRRQWGRQFVVMSALLEFATALLTAARGVIAAFGCLCLVVHVVVPCVATVGEFMIYTVPSEVANWRLQWAQESELQALEDRVTVLKKQRVMQMKREARRALEQQKVSGSVHGSRDACIAATNTTTHVCVDDVTLQALSQSRRTTETRRRSTAASRKAVPEPEEVVQMLPPVQPEVTDRVPSNEPTERVGRTLKKP